LISGDGRHILVIAGAGSAAAPVETPAHGRQPIADDEILERCLYPMINEGAKILDAGIACPRLRQHENRRFFDR
jgi:hypothetical protein